MSKNKRVLLGMSGGVDSSVSAILLREQGYEVVGVTMLLFDDAVEDAKKVCETLNIEHHVIDCREEFEKYVISNFIKQYNLAKTPNPCIECNRFLKFGKLFELAKELNCYYIATGHYAKVEYSNKYNRYVLKKSDSIKKDQSYVLYSLDKNVLPHILFPLCNYQNKEEIRDIAKKHGLNVASKSDSQDICFIKDNDYVKFLTSYGKVKLIPGNIILKDGIKLGVHNGVIKYTIGQRRGLKIAYKEPLYVTKLNKETNEVIVGSEKEIFANELIAEDVNFLTFEKLELPMNVTAKIRYSAKEAKAKIIPLDDDIVKVIFEENQRAITPGQSVVFYDNDIVIGGGKIV